MLENKTKRTIILTIDNNTAKNAEGNPILFASLRAILLQHGMTFADGKVVKGGLYFKREIEI